MIYVKCLILCKKKNESAFYNANHNPKTMKSFLLILIISFTAYNSFSQESKVKKFGYGFFFEGNRSFMEVKTGNEVVLKPTFGGGLGILVDYDLTKNFTFVGKLGLSFSNTAIDLIFEDGVAQEFKIYPQNIDIRLQANYALGKKKNRPYILWPSCRFYCNFNSPSGCYL